MSNSHQHHAVVFAGSPEGNLSLYHQIRFAVGDPTALICFSDPAQPHQRLLMIRDIEMDRAKIHARADHVVCPKDYAPEIWQIGDRELETAQSVAHCLQVHEITHITVDRTLPAIYAHYIHQAGISIECDPDLGVLDRRSKDEQEIEHLRNAQKLTEQCMSMACRTIAQSTADSNGHLTFQNEPLTSERLRQMIDVWFLMNGASTPHGSIVASGTTGADCHARGEGPISTGEPVIIDLFPHIKATHYHGDCTRCVVHGDIPDEVRAMHAAVLAAKEAAISATRAGVTADSVHAATSAVIERRGYQMGIPHESAPDTIIAMVHGTGHGIGLDVHEPPLIDAGGPVLVKGDVLTIEPGLYCKSIGGIRIEDMVVVTDDGVENFNTLQTGLSWM